MRLATHIVHVTLAVSGLALATLTGCSSDDGDGTGGDGGGGAGGSHSHDDLPAECEAIRDACHPKDVGVGRVSECHTISHDGVAQACADVEEECIQVCNDAPAPDGGAHSDYGGAGGMGGTDHGGMAGMDHGGSGGTG